MIKLVIALTFLLSISFCEQIVPIPLQYNGFSYGKQDSRLHIEAFYDLACPDSREYNSYLNELFGPSYKSYPFKFTIHHLPLPYHTHAFTLHQGAQYVYDKFGPDFAEEYINLIFQEQEKFTNQYTDLLTLKDVRLLITHVVKKQFGSKINENEFFDALSDRTVNLKVRGGFKYSCSRGIPGTPIYLANGVLIDGAESWTENEWKDFVQKYL